MSERPSRLGRAVVPLVVACLLVAVVAPAAVAGGLGGEATDTVVDSSAASQSSDRVGPGLRSANGTVEIVVRFEGDARLGASDAGDGGGISTADLKSSAESAQGDFERFAERKPGVTVERSFWLANAMLVTVDTESVAVERLLEVRGVERVHENFRVELDSASAGGGGGTSGVGAPGSAAGPTGTVSASSTTTNTTYGIDMVRAPEVWNEFDTRGEGATVAVLDTGIDPDHPDLTVNGWAEYDAEGNLVSTGPENASDVDGHGTHVAGTVAGGNASGTAIGVAPEAGLYGVKVLNDTGAGTFAQVVGGMEHATEDSDVDVLQMSLGGDGTFDGFIEPVQNARGAGKIVVVSAGNGGNGTSSSPGNVYESFAVGAVNDSRGVASFSGGETVNTSEDWNNETLTADWPAEYVVPDASAPGVGVYSATPGGTYAEKSGTSMAAPHVSGVAALMLAASTRNVSDEELSDTLRDTANHPDGTGPDTRYGSGIVDGYGAVSAITENRSNLTVTDFDAPNETAPGETVATTATVNNTGADPGTETVEYRFNGTVGDEANVSLAPGENATVSFSYVVPSGTPTNESYEHGAYTNDSNLTAQIGVVDAPFYEVTGLVAPGIAERNATLNATVNVTNRGVLAGENRTVELRLADPGNASDVRTLDATTVSLGAGNATAVALNGTVPSDVATGETTVAVASPEEAADAAIRVADAVGAVNGTVTDAETNATLAGLDVVVDDGTETVAETTTGENGTYDVDVPATRLNVTASNATYAPSTEAVTLNGSGDAATANLSLALRNGTLSGVVGASDRLEHPSNATVTVRNETADVVATVDAAADGSYGTALRPGTYDLTAEAPAFDAANATDVTIDPNATTAWTPELDPRPATLTGTVTAADGGDPIANATVTVGSGAGAPTAETDAAGNYSLTAPRGDYQVTASADGYVDATRAVTLSVNGTAEAAFALATPPEFLVDDFAGPSEIEQGASGDFDAEIRNAGGVSGDATVEFAVPQSGTSGSKTVPIAAGVTRTVSFPLSVGTDATTGGYDATVETADDSATVSFDVVEADDGGDTGGGSTGGGGGGGGGGGSGGSGGGDGGGSTEPDAEEEETTEPTNETDGPANETTEPTNGTDDPANETAEPTNGTDDPANETDERTSDDAGGSDQSDDATESDGDEGDENGDAGAPDGDTSNDEAPGFGAMAGVIAVLSAALVARLRGRNG